MNKDAELCPNALQSPFPSIDRRMSMLWERLAIVARSRLPIMLLGETGSGKEIAAEWVFASSGRGDVLLKVNCASLSESLVESELFGHERGAFTGAHAARAGIFEAADGGTLFLDEVGELPLATQAKLLRVLESGEVMRLGSTQARRVDVRIVSATHRDLPSQIARGSFREDLYFRLNGVCAHIPPLRERPLEVLPLARLFVERCARANGLPIPALAECARSALSRYHWPGNVRELRNVVERGVALCQTGSIGVEHLELCVADSDPTRSPTSERASDQRPSGIRAQWQRFEREQIEEALDQMQGNQTRAAKLLGISRRTLTNKLNMYGLPRPRKSPL
jgi:two-component system, NtrC family, response regulator AtoC